MASLLFQDVTRLHEGLARESALLDAELPLPLLYLWRGPRAIVMGKNQNPWKECDLAWMREHKLPLARRVSGGGTVYHDPGNLNISFIVDRTGYDGTALLNGVVSALKRLGVDARSQGTGNIVIDGQKISGSAFCYRKQRVLHHCTLLVDADLEVLRRALQPAGTRIETHAVDSVPATVTNLAQIHPAISLRAVCAALCDTFSGIWKAPLQPVPPSPLPTEALDHFASRDWIWGQTPRFEIALPSLGLTVTVRKGAILEASDPALVGMAFDARLMDELARRRALPLSEIERMLLQEGLSFH